jgi:hypothetical protein
VLEGGALPAPLADDWRRMLATRSAPLAMRSCASITPSLLKSNESAVGGPKAGSAWKTQLRAGLHCPATPPVGLTVDSRT